MKTFRKMISAIAVLTAVAFMAPEASANVSYESDFFALANQARASHGLQPLAGNAALIHSARLQSQRMASAGSIFHNANLAGEFSAGGWAALGENVGVGASSASLHDALMASPGHRANILGNYDQVGMGVVVSGSSIFVTQVFWKNATEGSPTVQAAGKLTCKKVKGRTKCTKSKKSKKTKKFVKSKSKRRARR